MQYVWQAFLIHFILYFCVVRASEAPLLSNEAVQPSFQKLDVRLAMI